MHAQSSPILSNHMDCSPPSSSVCGIFQAGILGLVVISAREDIPDPGIEPKSLEFPAMGGGFFTTAPPWIPLLISINISYLKPPPFKKNSLLYFLLLFVKKHFTGGFDRKLFWICRESSAPY